MSRSLPLTFPEYLTDPAISRSDLRMIGMETPHHWRWHRSQAEAPRSDAMDLGTAVHLAVLEPDMFELYVFQFDGTRRGKAWEEFRADLPEGAVALRPAAMRRALEIRDKVHALRGPRQLLRVGAVERSILWEDDVTGVALKSRPDLWNEHAGFVVDVKTTNSLDTRKLTRSIHDLAYDVQAALWEDASRNLEDDVPPIVATYHLWISTTGPVDVRMTELSPEWMARGRERMRAWIDIYAECKRTDSWPGHPRTIQTLELPTWAR